MNCLILLCRSFCGNAWEDCHVRVHLPVPRRSPFFFETLHVMSECRIHLTALKRPDIPKGAGKSLGNGHNTDTMLFENFIDTSWAFFIAPFWPQKVMKYQDDFNALPSQINTAIHHLLKLEQWTLKSYSNPHTWNVERLFGRIVILFTSYHPDHLLHELHPGIYNTCQYYNDNESLTHSGKESMAKSWQHHFIFHFWNMLSWEQPVHRRMENSR